MEIAAGRGAHDVIVDHCSISWATDENLSASGRRFTGETPEEWRLGTSHRITFSHCIVGEGLHRSTHSKGVGHSKGSLIHDNADEVAIIGNLYISNVARNPLFKGGARGVVVNNLVHNPGSSAISYGLVPEQWEGREWVSGRMAIVGNIVRLGPSSVANMAAIRFGSVWGVPACDAFVHDNMLLDRHGKPLPHVMSVTIPLNAKQAVELRLLSAPPLWPDGLQARSSIDVVDWVLANAGARPWDRDPVDRRLVAEARAGGGKIIDHEAEVGGLEAALPHAPAAPR